MTWVSPGVVVTSRGAEGAVRVGAGPVVPGLSATVKAVALLLALSAVADRPGQLFEVALLSPAKTEMRPLPVPVVLMR